jgi:hypothetical protein
MFEYQQRQTYRAVGASSRTSAWTRTQYNDKNSMFVEGACQVFYVVTLIRAVPGRSSRTSVRTGAYHKNACSLRLLKILRDFGPAAS